MKIIKLDLSPCSNVSLLKACRTPKTDQSCKNFKLRQTWVLTNREFCKTQIGFVKDAVHLKFDFLEYW